MDLRLLFMLTLLLLSPLAEAAGSITHMFIAEETAAKLTDPQLKNLIQHNKDAYLVGSTYPDTGYIQGTRYGFDSHRELFINALINYLQEKYPYPEQQNPPLVAFLLGCAVHQTIDQIFHGAFIHKISAEDFQGNWQAAHLASERNLDFLIAVEKNQWLVRPHSWWVPVADLVTVYHKMGKNDYSVREIIWGNTIYSLMGLQERLLALGGYSYARSHTPWLAKHYYDSPDGGMLFTEELAAHYVLEVWRNLLNKPEHKMIETVQQGHPQEILGVVA